MRTTTAKLIAFFKKQKEKKRGFTIAELASVGLLLVAVVALALDVSILMFASDACDKACKDCARAAGTGRTPGQAIDAMNAALSTHIAKLGPMMNNLQAQLMVYEDYSVGAPNNTSGGTNGPWVTTTGSGHAGVPPCTQVTNIMLTNTLGRAGFSPGPYVAVRCSMTATVPVPLFFFSNTLSPNTIPVASVYSYPLISTYATVEVAPDPNFNNPNQAQNAANVAANNAANAAAAAAANAAAAAAAANASTTSNSTSTNMGIGTTSTSSTSSSNSSSTSSSNSSSTSSTSSSHVNSTSTTVSSTSTNAGLSTTSSSSSTSSSNSSSISSTGSSSVTSTGNTSSNSSGNTSTNSVSTGAAAVAAAAAAATTATASASGGTASASATGGTASASATTGGQTI